MADSKKDLQEVRDIVENEGLGYAVQHYMSAESIADPSIAKRWREAKKALDLLEGELFS